MKWVRALVATEFDEHTRHDQNQALSDLECAHRCFNEERSSNIPESRVSRLLARRDLFADYDQFQRNGGSFREVESFAPTALYTRQKF